VLELKKSLETLRDMVTTRIQMLQHGVTFYTDEKRAFYLGEYLSKQLELDRLILSLSLALVQQDEDETN
jgi:hypothetical protein